MGATPSSPSAGSVIANGPRVAVVTGATSGIGLVVGRELSRAGYSVVLVGRDPGRLQGATATVVAAGGAPPAACYVADLARVREVKRLAAEIRAAHPRIALLVNGAGAIFFRRGETDEGHERTWALNVLAPFLLSRELAPSLEGFGSDARVVNIASAAHRGARLDLADPEGRTRYRGWRAYARSKLALILLTRANARRSGASGVAHFAVHPGFVRTRFGMNHGVVVRAGMHAAMLFAVSPEVGARTVLYAAASPELRGRSGDYLSRERITAPSAAALDDAEGERLSELLARTVDA